MPRTPPFSRAGADAEDARRRRGFRGPATQRDEPGRFPPPPQYGFQGRARELYELERRFGARRGIVLHAMGGMGKTALATEAAHWWTRGGLFRDGACFLSFEQFAGAERAVQVLGTYIEGPRFEQLPAAEQRRRAIEHFREKEVLMVWDNFESTLPQFAEGLAGAAASNPYTDDERLRLAELFRDLTAGPGKGCLLVTCRPGETGLPGAQRFELEGLARADSLWLLSRILQRDGLTLENLRLSRDRLDPLLQDLADHPLSLELVGPHLKTLTPERIRADFGRLLGELKQAAPEERNQSLLASLEFSRRHLSPAAREALPWLGLFSGGVFEDNLLDVSELAPEAWEPIRRELQAIALLRQEDDMHVNRRPFLRFHPTLAFAAADPGLAQRREIRDRFIRVYLALMRGLDEALTGSQPRAALEILHREEANYRAAADDRGQLDRALQLYRQALNRFHEAGDEGAIVQSYNLLGVTESKAGRLAEARAWFEKSRELAVQLQDQRSLGSAAQNLGIAAQQEGEAARQNGDETAAWHHFEEARRSLEESLRIQQALGEGPTEANAWSQLSRIHLALGDLATAERHAHEALKIRESLGLLEAWQDCGTLSDIARTGGDLVAATRWEQKRDILLAERKRRAGGGDSLPARMLESLQALTSACTRAGFGDGSLGPAEEGALAQLDQLPGPFPALATFLRDLASGRLSPVPGGLPAEIAQWLEGVSRAIRKASSQR